jgi:hypothetical protein
MQLVLVRIVRAALVCGAIMAYGTAQVAAESPAGSDESPQAIASERETYARVVVQEFDTTKQGALKEIGNEQVAGQWNVIDQKVKMQAIHMVAVPGDPDAQGHPTTVKVLIVNGSSNRDTVQQEVLDGFPNRYADVDSAGVFDPKKGTQLPGPLGEMSGLLERVEPIPRSFIEAFLKSKHPHMSEEQLRQAQLSAEETFQLKRSDIDLFCGGHLHTYTGDVLFVGGTQKYLGTSFLGNKAMWLWNWREQRFVDVQPKLQDGRWYPTLLPRGDGRIMIVAGVSERQHVISRKIEAYDPVDNRLSVYPRDDDTLAKNLIESKFAFMGGQWDMFPRLIPLRDGRALLTGDGTGYGNRQNMHTLVLEFRFDAQGEQFAATFADGPTRGVMNKFYATQLFDPRLGKEDEFLVLGGMIGIDDLNLKEFRPLQQSTSDLSRYVPPAKVGGSGQFFFTEDFLGGFGRGPDGQGRNLDTRLNHVAVYLPTGDFIVLGGGNLGYLDPKFHPNLYRPDNELLPGDTCDWGNGDTAPRAGFCRLIMNPHKFPRLYHTSAVLLMDGRVLLGGGNAARAAWKGQGTSRTLDLRPSPEYHSPGIPGEVQFFEVFSPPYKFAPNPPEIAHPSKQQIAYGEEFDFTVTKHAVANADDIKVTFIKLGSVTHSMDNGQRFANLEVRQVIENGQRVRVRAPALADRELFPPGYYMLFYVHKSRRVPSREALLVQLMPTR